MRCGLKTQPVIITVVVVFLKIPPVIKIPGLKKKSKIKMSDG